MHSIHESDCIVVPNCGLVTNPMFALGREKHCRYANGNGDVDLRLRLHPKNLVSAVDRSHRADAFPRRIGRPL